MPGKTYMVEHLDPELGKWSALEYRAIATECSQIGSQFCLSGVKAGTIDTNDVSSVPIQGFAIENRSVEDIFSNDKHRVCLLDPAAAEELSPKDGKVFDVFLFGGILGDDPPRDRTSELRKKGFVGRRLGPVQMTTDTAVRATRLVVEDEVQLSDIPYVDHPELKFNKHESTQMPFRYILDASGQPIMPKGMFELIRADSEKGLDDML